MRPVLSAIGRVGRYTVWVQGRVASDLAEWLGSGVEVREACRHGRQATVIANIVADQPAIVGLIRHLHNAGILLLSVERAEVAGGRVLPPEAQ